MQEQKQQPSGTVRISQSASVRPAVFDGLVRPGEQMQQKVLVFRGQMCALFGQEDCLEAVETDVPVKVGKPDCNIAAADSSCSLYIIYSRKRASICEITMKK